MLLATALGPQGDDQNLTPDEEDRIMEFVTEMMDVARQGRRLCRVQSPRWTDRAPRD